MAYNDVTIRKFTVNDIRSTQNKNLVLYKVVYSQYKENLLESNENVIVYKRFRDFDKLYQECCKLRNALYIKEEVPYFPSDSKSSKLESNQNEINERRKSALNLLEYMAKHQCFYKSKLFTKFFEESELKIDKQVYTKDELIRNLSINGNNLILDSNGDHLNSSSNQSSLDNQFPIPFQYLNNQGDQNLEKKFKSKSDKTSKEHSDVSESNDTYLCDAAHLICQAQLNDERQEYESSFESYKCAISILLKGVKHEQDRSKKLNVKRKVELYLSRAEEIYEKHLKKEERNGNRKFSLDTPYKQILKDEFLTDKDRLSKFKLLSFANKVQIVYDVQLNERFAIKVVHKISNLNGLKRFFIFPKQCTNMIQLYQIYENDYAYYLVLEFLNCNKLTDILEQIRERLSPCVECLFDPIDTNEQTDDEELNKDEIEIIDLNEEGILFDKEKFNDIDDEDDYYLNRYDSIKTLNEIENDLLDYQIGHKSKLSTSRSEQKLSNMVHSKSTDFNQNQKHTQNLNQKSADSSASNKFTLTGIFDRAKNLIKNVDHTIFNTTINQARLSIDNNIDFQCNLNNYILECINSKLLNVNYCDHHLNKQLNEFENEGKMLLNEQIVKRWLWQILIALENLHSQGVLYMNLNPSNILIHNDLQNVSLAYKYSLDYKQIAIQENLDPLNASQLIVSSFYSKYSSDSSYSYYIAPELFVYASSQTKITGAVDFWSLGVLAFELISNRPLCSFIPSINCKNLIQFPSFMSIEAKNLIEKLLLFNPSERLGCDDIKNHPFFRQL